MPTQAEQVPVVQGLGSGPQQLINIGTAFLVVTWITVFLRLWTRLGLVRSFGWDDATILLTMVPFSVQCGYVIEIGLVESHPDTASSLKSISGLVTDIIAFTGSYVLTTIFLKISLALFFLRIIITKWQRAVIIWILVVYTIFGAVYFGITALGCGNPANFLINTVQGKCISITGVVIPMSYAQTSFNAVVDWIFVAIPVHTLWHLNMPRVTKMWASVLILMGALGSVVSLIRIKTVHGLVPGHDFFKSSTETTIWAIIEPGLGIAAASLATLRPILKQCIETTRSGYSGDKSIGKSNRSETRTGPLNSRSTADRSGFRPFNSTDSEVELTPVRIQHDLEKGTPPADRSPGIWVERTTIVDT